jgi:hypothetical protein
MTTATLAKPPKPAPAKAPRRLADFPDYNAAHARLRELEDRRDKIRKAIDEYTFQEANRRKRGVPGAEIDELARRLVAGEKVDVTAAKPTFDLEKANRELAVLDRAVALAKDALDAVIVRVGREIREDLLAEHRSIAKQIGEALRVLGAQHKAHLELFECLARQGISWDAPLAVPLFQPLVGNEQAVEQWFAQMWQYAGFEKPGHLK